jgi:hypothetical protein
MGLGLLGLLQQCSLPVAAQVRPKPAELVADLHQQAQAQLRFFGLLIYEIRLWAREQIDAKNWLNQPFALELEYARKLSGKEIARRSLLEMRRQAEIGQAQATSWLQEMEAAFPDVQAGDRISGVYEPGGATQFFVNGQLRRSIKEAEFGRLFFGIWLAPQSSEPELRAKLLSGQSVGR